jgi:hypothetical protein
MDQHSENPSTLSSLRGMFSNLPDSVPALLDCFGEEKITHLSDTTAVGDIKKAVEASLIGLKAHLDGDIPDLPPGVSSAQLIKLEKFIQHRGHFLLGLRQKADRGVTTVQELEDADPRYQALAVRYIQRAGEDALKQRLNDRQNLSVADYEALATLDWDLISPMKQSGYGSCYCQSGLPSYVLPAIWYQPQEALMMLKKTNYYPPKRQGTIFRC